MKIRNLLLAGLAIVAMSACSDNEGLVDNGLSTENGETASLQVHLSFPTTRAVTGVAPGEGVEWKATTVTAVLVYPNGEVIITPTVTAQAAPRESDDISIVTTSLTTVSAGNGVKVYAFINVPSNLFPAKMTLAQLEALRLAIQTAPENSMDYLLGGIAANNSFMMTSVAPTTVNIAAGKENTATVQVERISVKLEEGTTQKFYDLLDPADKGAETILIKVLQYTYCNLANSSYVLPHNTTDWGVSGTAPNPIYGYLFPYADSQTDNEDHEMGAQIYQWKNIAAVPAEGGTVASTVTYSLENIVEKNTVTVDETPIIGAYDITKHTSIIYKSQVYWEQAEGDPVAATTFYVAQVLNPETDAFESTVFKTWASLKAAIGIDDTYQDNPKGLLEDYDIKMYMDGICYYTSPLDDAYSIYRNHWYKLNVETIADLGFPFPTIPTDNKTTKIGLTIQILPWTVHVNGLDL